jgi:hypothetical protein
VREQAAVAALQRVRHRACRAAGRDRDAKAALLQFGRALQRCLAAFDHVGQQRHAVRKARAGGVHLRGRAQRLDAERADPAIQIGSGTFEGDLDAVHRQRVGARQDQRLRVVPRIECGAKLAADLGHPHHGLAVEVAAALREGLVLEPDHRGTGALAAAHHVRPNASRWSSKTFQATPPGCASKCTAASEQPCVS